ncbi:TOMM precursor leader peptide-binding protein [Calothrix sp. FACHB-1219]|uniref:TOMM precursor leader peptide-binding protein n=1 Tax=unclassified Calothrix TaxID=2619626 RepID=UPI0016853973|nr:MULTISPECIES: TOMM precursor leader peptide-binding protein [unclassified Calothrix]MBD2203240.1 TOMM precursor leader peptide-binding protein [Calothrix sp. FACHB-168]MBD2216464.1 TOMM precursor leader peptide-binding protein [Calothrix sp. FACHB-1219]
MLIQPKFHEHFHVELSPPKTVFLLSEKGHFILNGRLYYLLAPLLNGLYTVEEIIQQLQGQAKADEIIYGLEQLHRKGYITNADNIPPHESAFWGLLNQDGNSVTQAQKAAKVSITTFGSVKSQPLIAILESLNISVADTGKFAVVVTDDYLQPGLAQFNYEALQQQLPWLLVKPVGSVIWIGPIFRPGVTGCWECLAQRLRMNREVESFLQEQKQTLNPLLISRAALPSTVDTALNLAATEIAKWLSNPEQHTLEGTLLTFDLINLNIQRHTLVRRPQCDCCGEIAYQEPEPQPLVLTSQPKQLSDDGGYRSCLPEQAWQNYEHHISPVTGVIKSIFQPFQNNELIHAYVVEHSLPYKGRRLEDLRQKSFGKGKTAAQAKMSALGEAIERYCGAFTGEEPRVKAAYANLQELAIHPDKFMHYSANQYRDRQIWNQQHHVIQWIPDPFDESQEIEWSPFWSLNQQQFKYLPTAYCYYGYPLPENHNFCFADTNGTAAGSCKEEAILQGFMELVERDAVAIWWYNRLAKPGVNLHSFDDPYLYKLQTYYKFIGRDFWVLDLTTDLNIPTFAAISRRYNQQPEDILFGFGTHFDAKIALLRAVTEMNQMVFLSSGGNPQASAKFSRQDIQHWCTTATLENQPYLSPDINASPKVYTDYAPYQSNDLQQDVINCVNLATTKGLEILVLEQTHPDIAIPVVKVVVPGLRHFWAQFAPGRLYEVPVNMGWLKAELPETQLNPIPMFL